MSKLLVYGLAIIGLIVAINFMKDLIYAGLFYYICVHGSGC